MSQNPRRAAQTGSVFVSQDGLPRCRFWQARRQTVLTDSDYVGGWIDLNLSNTRDDEVAVEKKITLPELQE